MNILQMPLMVSSNIEHLTKPSILKNEFYIFLDEITLLSNKISESDSNTSLIIEKLAKFYYLPKNSKVKNKNSNYNRMEVYSTINEFLTPINELKENNNFIFDFTFYSTVVYRDILNILDKKKVYQNLFFSLFGDKKVFNDMNRNLIISISSVNYEFNESILFLFIKDNSFFAYFDRVVLMSKSRILKIYDRSMKSDFIEKSASIKNIITNFFERAITDLEEELNPEKKKLSIKSTTSVNNPEQEEDSHAQIFTAPTNSSFSNSNDKPIVNSENYYKSTNDEMELELKKELERSQNIQRYDEKTFQTLLKQSNEKIENTKNAINQKVSNNFLEELVIPNLKKENPSNVDSFTFNNIRRKYRKEFFKKDIIKIFENLANNKKYPLFFDSMEVEHNDNGITARDLYTVTLRDIKNKKIIIPFNIPRLIENKFYYINNTYYFLANQVYSKSILKIKEDTVAFTTNYNKTMIYRMGSANNEVYTSLIKILIRYTRTFNTVLQNKSSDLSKYSIPLPYTLFNLFAKIDSFKVGDIFFKIEEPVGEKSIKGKLIKIGEDSKNNYYCNKDNTLFTESKTNGTMENSNITAMDFIKDSINLSPIVKEKITQKENSVFTRINIAGRKVPLIITLMTEFSLLEIFNTYKINYKYFKDSIRTIPKNYIKLKLKNGDLIVERNNLEHRLLLNGLFKLGDISNYTYEELVQKNNNPVLIDWFYKSTSNRMSFQYTKNTLLNLIDPITKDILTKEKLPTDILNALLYCNTLLKNNEYNQPYDFTSYRLRNEEQLITLLYKHVTDAVTKAQLEQNKTNNRATPSFDQDSIIKDLLVNVPSFENYSDINFYNEIDSVGKSTYKGVLGLNQSRSASRKLRMQHNSAVGAIDVLNQVDNSNSGVNRFSPFNTLTIDERGNTTPLDIAKISKTPYLYDFSKFLSYDVYSEPFLASSADAPRISMSAIQSRHALPLESVSTPFIKTGLEPSLKYLLSSSFSIKNHMNEPAVVKQIDTNHKLIMLEGLKTKKRKTFSYENVVKKNGGGGFYKNVVYTPCVKVGERVEDNHPIALDSGSFKNGSATNSKLIRCAIINMPETIEDGNLLSNTLAKDTVFNYVAKKDVLIYPNQEVLEMKNKIGEKIEVNESLLSYTEKADRSGDDTLFKKFNLDENILSSAKSKIKSKYKGTIVDIKIYYNGETLEDKLVKQTTDYLNKLVETKRRVTDSDDEVIEEKVIKVKGDRLGLETIKNGILIEYYIETKIPSTSGSKLTFQSTKGVLRTMDKSEMPKTLDGNPVDIIVSDFSIITRLTMNNNKLLYFNKVAMGFNEKLKELIKKN